MKKYFILYLPVLILLFNIFALSSAFAENTSLPVGERIVREAALWIGSPYGSSDGADGYGSPVDCSGLVMQVFRKFNIDLPRSSHEQAEEGEMIPLDEMLAGDIVCFVYEDGRIGHVGIFVGGRTMIHAPNPQKTVEISRCFEDWGSIKSAFGRRLVPESDYVPEKLTDDIEKEISSLLKEKNALKTDHLEYVNELLEKAVKEKEEAQPVQEADTDVCPEIKKHIILHISSPYMLVDGQQKLIETDTDITPLIMNNRTHLPLRSIAEEFGAEVEWIGGAEKEIKVNFKDVEISLWIGSDKTTVNGKTKYIDSAPVIIKDRTFLPIRFIAEELGWDLDWNGEKQKISLSATINEI